jgi:hypothetical protein
MKQTTLAYKKTESLVKESAVRLLELARRNGQLPIAITIKQNGEAVVEGTAQEAVMCLIDREIFDKLQLKELLG